MKELFRVVWFSASSAFLLAHTIGRVSVECVHSTVQCRQLSRKRYAGATFFGDGELLGNIGTSKSCLFIRIHREAGIAGLCWLLCLCIKFFICV